MTLKTSGKKHNFTKHFKGSYNYDFSEISLKYPGFISRAPHA